MVSRNRRSGGDCKPVYAAISGSRIVVNDTFKRQFKLSGVNTRDDRKGTVEGNVETLSDGVKTEVISGTSGQVQRLPDY